MQNKDTSVTSSPQSPPELSDDLLAEHGLAPGQPDKPESAIDQPDIEPVAPDVHKETEDADTDAAIDDIVKSDADLVLDIDSAQPETPAAKVPQKHGRFTKLKAALRRYWDNPYARWGSIIGLVVVLAGVFTLPASRYAVLNLCGVRVSTTVRVIDNETRLPLKNVTVQIGDNATKTNGDGQATLRNVRLGKQTIEIKRIAFEPVVLHETLGWGSNPLDDVLLHATGVQLSFVVSDYVSGAFIESAEATAGEAAAFADKQGQILLSVPEPEGDVVTVRITAKGYADQDVTLSIAQVNEVQEVAMLPDQPVVFITKQSGRFDVYKTDVTGKTRELLLAGTGREQERSLRLVTSPDGAWSALVSTRGAQHDADGYPMSTLTLIDTDSGDSKAIDLAQNIELLGWKDDVLVYRSTYAYSSAATSERSKLVAYNVTDAVRQVLATADYFTGIYMVDKTVYYATAQTDPKRPAEFASIGIDGKGARSLLKKHIWALVRSGQYSLGVETPDGWYDYTIGDASVRPGGQAVDYQSVRAYVMRGEQTVWVDTRDGKQVIVLSGKDGEKVLTTDNGITQPLRWLSDTILTYRVARSGETADYVVSTQGGEARKVTDLTNVAGFSNGYGL